MKDRLNLYLQRAHLQATNMRGEAIREGANKARWHYQGKLEAIEEMLAEVNKPCNPDSHLWVAGAEGAFAGMTEHCSNCGEER